MKKLLYLSMLAITILASCNSKEKEDKAFARVSTSNNPQEMRAYLDNYFEEASPEHLVKIRKNLRVWVDDSTAYANICKTKDLATKISLENEYMEKFKDGGNHKTEISNMLAKDQKAKEELELKEQKAQEELELQAERQAKYKDFKDNVVDYIFGFGNEPVFVYWAFSAPDINGCGKGVFINNLKSLKEKFTYKLADNEDLQVKSKNGSASITFLNDGLYRGQDYFKRIYAPIDYKNCKKYF
ncbi:MAG: hypothetical protein V8T23_03370 [Prevotella sp.]